MNWYSKAMSNSFNFYDRATRKEYWWFFFFWSIFLIAALFLDNIFDTTFKSSYVWYEQQWDRYDGWVDIPITEEISFGYGWMYTIYVLVHFFPCLSAMTRRLHDCNRSGWWVTG